MRRRILTVARTLASDDFIGPMSNSFSSIRDTLAHILSAEWIWLERWQGRSPRALWPQIGQVLFTRMELRLMVAVNAKALLRHWASTSKAKIALWKLVWLTA